MAATGLTDDDWEILLDRIQQGKCTPFLGAGTNAGILPGGASLARELAERFKYPLRDKDDLARVTQFVAVVRGEHTWVKEQLLASFSARVADIDLRSPLSDPAGTLCTLAELPLPLYLTTNYDDFLFQALVLTGKTPVAEICRWNEFLRTRPRSSALAVGFDPRPSKPLVYHLHGRQDFAESLVLTEDDYLDFLINMSRVEDLLPQRIKDALAYSSLLFVGYRLADLNFRVLFRSINRTMEGVLHTTSVAVQLPPEDGRSAQAYLNQYFGKVNIKVYWGEAAGFVSELRRRLVRRGVLSAPGSAARSDRTARSPRSVSRSRRR